MIEILFYLHSSYYPSPSSCLYCCTVHFVDSLNITQPTNALIVCHLNAKLNPICHLLALLGGATIVVVSRLRVKTLSLLLDVSIAYRLSSSGSTYSS